MHVLRKSGEVVTSKELLRPPALDWYFAFQKRIV